MESPWHALSINALLSWYLLPNDGIITMGIQSMVEKLYLLMTEKYKRVKKDIFSVKIEFLTLYSHASM